MAANSEFSVENAHPYNHRSAVRWIFSHLFRNRKFLVLIVGFSLGTQLLYSQGQIMIGRAAEVILSRAEGDSLRHHLTDALRRLPPGLRQVVVLRDVYDLPHDSIAEELDISVTAAKVRLHRARRRLRDDLYAHPHEGEARAV